MNNQDGFSSILQDGTCSVAWVPPVPGEYKIHVKIGGKPVKGSPFSVFVAGEGQKRAHLSVGSTSEVPHFKAILCFNSFYFFHLFFVFRSILYRYLLMWQLMN